MQYDSGVGGEVETQATPCFLAVELAVSCRGASVFTALRSFIRF